MKRPSKRKDENRTITVDFQNDANYQRFCQDGSAFVEVVVVLSISRGCQLKQTCGCPGGCGLTRPTHYTRIRLGGVVIWRLQCHQCGAVLTIFPHFVLRDQSIKPARSARFIRHSWGGKRGVDSPDF